ncbi:YgaP family membrane protein [Oricola nitratireducens]|jgi:hypothetical protein|uniref:YgaP family membrane protein n=1 Tax=Oricola nitratireducens TaxID=2775868 RepID=UPI001AED46E3|nr:DUF2892 domain-containing protein [Oricola nitratireducens]
MFINPNLGRIDRLIRFAIGVFLIATPYLFSDAALWESPVARWGIPIVGTVLVLTAFLRCCPIYRLFGASTCRLG